MIFVVLAVVAVGALLLTKRSDEGMDFAGTAGGAPMDIGGKSDFGHRWAPSPNYTRGRKATVTMLVWHYTAGTNLVGAETWLRDTAAKASAHFIIGRNGDVVQLVQLADTAWHAGNSDVNNRSIGIELVSPGWVTSDGKGGWKTAGGDTWKADATPKEATLRLANGNAHTHYWVPYTAAQMQACKDLVARLRSSTWAECLNDQRGHEDIALPTGHVKTDPGPLFPWDDVSTFGQRSKHKTTVQGMVA